MVVVDNAECDLTGYSLVIVRAPAGTDLPANPIIDLGAIAGLSTLLATLDALVPS